MIIFKYSGDAHGIACGRFGARGARGPSGVIGLARSAGGWPEGFGLVQWYVSIDPDVSVGVSRAPWSDGPTSRLPVAARPRSCSRRSVSALRAAGDAGVVFRGT